MIRGMTLPVAATLLAISAAALAATPGNPETGRQQYEAKCGGCHSLDSNRVGPRHRGVIGRRPGSVPGYAYSPAVKALGGVWTPNRMDQWLQDPQKLAPGSKMYLTVSSATTRRDIIAYLQSVSPPATKKPR